MDELEKCGFYKHWRKDFELVQEQGIRFLRYGPPIHTTWLGEGHYDWAFCDETLEDLKRRDIVPILDLCHFGVPDWIGDFQNPDFPKLFERYAADFAARYPWIQLYTPVNEMFICATFSARWGWWNEELSNDTAFITALKHLVKANILAMHAILDIQPDALFIQSESSEYFHPESPARSGTPTPSTSSASFARPELWLRRFGPNDGVPARLRDDARRIQVLPHEAPPPPLHHGQ